MWFVDAQERQSQEKQTQETSGLPPLLQSMIRCDRTLIHVLVSHTTIYALLASSNAGSSPPSSAHDPKRRKLILTGMLLEMDIYGVLVCLIVDWWIGSWQ